MVQLTDLLERKRALEEQEARIQRDLGILRQIDELAAQLDEPAAGPATRITVERPEPEPVTCSRCGGQYGAGGHGPGFCLTPEEREAQRRDAELSPAETPEERRAREEHEAGQRAAAEAFAEPVAPKQRKSSSGEVKKVVEALEHFRGEALQADLVRKTGMSSGQVSQACALLEDDGRIRCIGKGGYQNKSKRWRLTSAETGRPLSTRVRKALERDEKKRGMQPPTHEGRILSLLTINPGFTVPEIAGELGIPASTVGRLVGKLKQEGEVTDRDDSGHFRRVMS